MILYRVKYSVDAKGENYKATKAFEDFSEMKKKARELARLTNRMIIIEWSYASSIFWSLLRACPTEKDVNNAKEKH